MRTVDEMWEDLAELVIESGEDEECARDDLRALRSATEDEARGTVPAPIARVLCADHPEYRGSLIPKPSPEAPQGCIGCWRVFCSLPSCRGPGVMAP